mmetsp:Transcript_102808/g.177404  ORF Transcript_102808/g.177404 Transcript_102808/m.177404 type:complete len:105 (+) Transcript_102808:112-426(+)
MLYVFPLPLNLERVSATLRGQTPWVVVGLVHPAPPKKWSTDPSSSLIVLSMKCCDHLQTFRQVPHNTGADAYQLVLVPEPAASLSAFDIWANVPGGQHKTGAAG